MNAASVPESNPLETVRFLILMQWGRVGSNLILNILNQLEHCKVENEKFLVVKAADDQADWLTRFFELDTPQPSHSLIGTKENILTVADLGWLSRWIEKHDVRLIKMRRDDLLRAAVSQMRAELYAAHTLASIGQAKWAVRRGMEPLGPTPLDVRKLVATMEHMDKARTALAEFKADRVFEIEYEQVNYDLPTVVHGLKTYLGQDAEAPFRTVFLKATPDDLHQAVTNMDEVAKALRGTRFASFLN